MAASTSAQVTHDTSVANAHSNRVNAEQTALVNLRANEGLAHVSLAQALATHEADYQIALANYEAAVAASFAVAAGTPAAQFQATNADAQADWIVAMKPAYVTHASAIEQANADRATNLAFAWGTRETQRAASDATFAISSSNSKATRTVNEAAAIRTQQQSILTASHLRQSGGASASYNFEIQAATLEKQYAIVWAEADKQFHIERLQDDDQADDNRKEARADAARDRSVGVADAKLLWNQAEVASRKVYSQSVATSVQALAGTLANVVRTAAIDQAGFKATLDAAYGNSEAVYWSNETGVMNAQRAAKALADAAKWTAEHDAMVAASAAIDTAVGTPWSQFLEDRAIARQSWWNAVQPVYLTWYGNRNTVESTYQNSISTAHVTQTANIASADSARATAVANSAHVRDTSRAAAHAAFASMLVTPSQTYVNAMAQAEREYEVAVANAVRDYAVNNDSPAYQSALTAADTARKNAITAAENAYSPSEAAALADRVSDLALADNVHALDVIAADVARANTIASARRDYQVAETNAYLAHAQADAALNRAYWIDETSELLAAANALASSSATPWASHDAAMVAGHADWVASVAAAKETKKVAEAGAQATAEIAIAAADKTNAIAQAASKSTFDTAWANAALGQGNAYAAVISAFGSSGGYKATYPATSAPDDLAGLYTVPAANSNDHLATVTLTTWSSGWQWGWGGWGWGGLWAGVNGWGGLWGGGWGMGWGMGMGGGWGGGWNPWWGGGWWNAWNSGYFGLPAPAELRLPADFWDIEGEIDGISEHGEGALMARFASGPFELAPLEVDFNLPSGAPAPGAPPPAPLAPATPPAPPPAAFTINYDHAQIEEILAQEDPELAEWWSSRGRIARVVVPGRPADLPIATFASAEAIRAFEQRAFESRTAEQPWIKVPDEWESWQVALHVVEQARTKGSELNKSFDLYRNRRATVEETVNDVLPIPDAEPIEVKLASLDPENVPHEKVSELVRSGRAIEELKSIGRTFVLAVAARLPLADGTVRSLILEHVPPGWFTPDRWRIVGIGPIVDPDPERGHGGYSLEKALDTYVFAPKEAAMAQELANAAEFALHVIPLGGTVDYLSRGEYGEAAISFAGDVAMLLTGGGSKAIAAMRAAKGLGVTQKGLVTAGIITEASIAGIRGVQGALMLYEGKGGYGQIGEAVLRLFGVKLLLNSGKVGIAATKYAKQAGTTEEIVRTMAVRHRAPSILTKGDLFERSVKETFASKTIIRENEKVYRNGKLLTEIDFETKDAIVECGISLAGKMRQIKTLASIAAERGKKLIVVWGPDTPAARVQEIQEEVQRVYGKRVSFVPHAYPVDPRW